VAKRVPYWSVALKTPKIIVIGAVRLKMKKFKKDQEDEYIYSAD